MKKTFTILIAALAAILMMVQPFTASGQTYKKVTSAPTGPNTWDGEYLLVYESSNTAYVWTGVDATSCYKTATISNGVVTKPDDAVSITLASMTGGYSVKVNGGTYNGKYTSNASNNGITFNTNAVANTLTYENSATTISCGGKKFRYNKTSGQTRFRYFGSEQEKVQLYERQYTLTYAKTGSGTVTGVYTGTQTNVNSNTDMVKGTQVTLTAEPADGYEFSSWEVSGTGASLSSTTTNPTTFTMGTANATVTANFTATGGSTTYSVTYNPNGATSGTVPIDDNSYEAYDQVTVFGNTGNLAKTGNAFSGWCMNAEGTGPVYGPNNTATFNITANTTLYAKWTPYTITAASNNNNYGTVQLSGTVITATPAAGYTYASTAYTVSSGSATVVQNGNEFTVTPSSDCTVTINFSAIPTHTATFSVNGATTSQSFLEGAAIVFPSDPANISGKKFVGWVTETIAEPTDEEPSFVNTATETMGSSDVTYYAVFADETAGTPVTDELTTSTFGSPTSYTSWSGKYDKSDARYAGQSSGGSSYIQIRATSPSGIVSTTSGGKATKVTVSWNSTTSDNRTFDVYGKTSAYTNSADLYGDSKGTLLGSLYYNVPINNVTTTTTELTITGNYKFIGLRSNSGAMYLDEIDIQWTPVTYANYSTSVEVKTITDLSYTGTPTKTTYSEGESFDPTGLTVTATYDDNSEENVTEYVTWAPDPLTQGTTSVTGTFMELTVNITGLTVKAAAGTETNPYTVAQAIANTPSSGTSSNVYIHGIVSAFYSSTITGDATYHRYYISDNGTTSNQLLVFNGKKRSGTAFSDDDDIRVGDIVTIYGGLTTYNNTKEVAADNYIVSHQLVAPTLTPDAGAVLFGTTVAISDLHTTNTTIYYTTNGTNPTNESSVYSTPISITTATTIKAIAVKSGYTTSDVATAGYTILVTPTITVTAENPINVSAAGGSGELALTYENFTITQVGDFDVQFYDANDQAISSQNKPTWITVNVASATPSGYKVTYSVQANDGAARSAYFKVDALDDNTELVYSNKVTVTQAAADYATLPFIWDNTTVPTGITTKNTGGFYSGSPYIKLNQTGTGEVKLKLNEAPGIIAFDIKGNPSSGTTSTGTFTVATSVDGTNYTTLATYTSIVNKIQTMYFTNLNDDTRYIKWSYAKESGNVALGNFNIQGIANQSATITPESNHIYVVNSGATMILDGNYSGILNNAENLIIEDGGELITHNAVQATVKKNIEKATNWGDATTYDADGWYFIASPVDGADFPTGTFDNQDIYQLDWANNKWLNLQNSSHSSLLEAGFQRGTGYLYATNNEDGNTLSVAGEIQPLSSEDKATVTLATTGWNLIGNPLTCKVTVDHEFGLLNNGSTVDYTGTTVNPFQGIVVWGSANEDVTFTKAATQNAAAPSNNSSLQMTLAKKVTSRGETSSKIVDNAVVSFSESKGLPKFNMLGGNVKLYIPQNDEEYAVAFSNKHGDVPLNFKADEVGTYTISFEGEEMDLNGIYLIDILDEQEIDLSVEPSYTFIGSPADRAARFKIVFRNVNGDNANDIFAYQNGSDIVVTGEGELQIFDVMGRIVSKQYVNGVETINVNAYGVYIMKLNGMTQKIIIK